MKNKELIKKSIEENIVNHTAVLNNLKAKAAVLEAERASRQAARFGLKKAAICAVAVMVCAACALSSIFFFQGDDNPPVAVVNSEQEDFSEQLQQNNSANLADESSQSAQNPNAEKSRETKGESSVGGIVTQTPLNDEEKAFFEAFSDNFAVLQNLINARLDAVDADNGYAKVQDSDFQSINDIKNFLYSFMKPEAAGEILVGLTSGALPYYKEKNGVLYQRTEVGQNGILAIKTDTAFLVSKDENTLVINAMLQTTGAQDYYRKFEFENINGEWLYAWRTPDMLNNTTNYK
ncbi:MAG TPA: hypothetical protein PLD48_00220 [Bacillota bacterium]|nr:hypothetical protein [Bacillota bacterium]HOK68519.1 hypothetical protein [Bacillota bacterium]HPP85047.1 hypothetical protein [Bacillota bacterium]